MLKNINLQQNIIKLYGIIWGQRSPAVHIELEGDPEYITKSKTYNSLWLLTKANMCTPGIDHTSNGYYYSVISTRTILCLRQGRYKPKEAL